MSSGTGRERSCYRRQFVRRLQAPKVCSQFKFPLNALGKSGCSQKSNTGLTSILITRNSQSECCSILFVLTCLRFTSCWPRVSDETLQRRVSDDPCMTGLPRRYLNTSITCPTLGRLCPKWGGLSLFSVGTPMQACFKNAYTSRS